MSTTIENDFVVCRNCIRAFDVDHWWSNNHMNPRIISSQIRYKNDDPNDEEIDTTFEAECPYCFHVYKYNNLVDIRFAGGLALEKEKEIYKRENEMLRKRIIDERRSITQLETKVSKLKREKASLNEECKKLADTIHDLKTGSKPTMQRKQLHQKTIPPDSPYIR